MVEENACDNVIQLYSKPFIFDRPPSDKEDHPLLIEFVTEEVFPLLAEGVHYLDHTLYITPYDTTFIFFSEKDKRIAISLSENSKETKLLELYRKKLVVDNHFLRNHTTVPCPSVRLNERAIYHDQQVDRMKGLFYGYYIGGALSVSSGILARHKALTRLNNLFATVLSSTERKVEPYQRIRIQESLSMLAPSWFRYLQAALKDPSDVTCVVHDLENRFGVKFPQKAINIEAILGWLEEEQVGEVHALNWLEKEWAELKKMELRERKLVNPTNRDLEVKIPEMTISFAESVVGDSQQRKVMTTWCNELFTETKYSGKIATFKDEISDSATRIAKRLYPDAWDNSNLRNQLNAMRKYVRGAGDEVVWDNGIISAFTAVLAKGDEWITLLNFMKSKGIMDYRLAFAIYGELNGFAYLGRDFTDIILGEEGEYRREVYNECYWQIYGLHPKSVTIPIIDEANKREVDNTISIIKSSNSLFPTFNKNRLSIDYVDVIVNDLSGRFALKKQVQKDLKKDLEWVLDPSWLGLGEKDIIKRVYNKLVDSQKGMQGSAKKKIANINESKIRRWKEVNIDAIIQYLQDHYTVE